MIALLVGWSSRTLWRLSLLFILLFLGCGWWFSYQSSVQSFVAYWENSAQDIAVVLLQDDLLRIKLLVEQSPEGFLVQPSFYSAQAGTLVEIGYPSLDCPFGLFSHELKHYGATVGIIRACPDAWAVTSSWAKAPLTFAALPLLVLVLVVLTRQKRQEASLNQTKGSLEQERKERVLAEKRATITDVARQVVHDIRTPISALDLAVESPGNKESRELMTSAVERIKAISGRLLEEAKAVENQVHPVDVADVAEKLLPEFRAIGGGEVVSDFSRDFKIQKVMVDRVELQRIISNLVVNAVEALDKPSIGVVKLSGRVKHERMELSIEDNGKGIPPELVSKLFSRGATFGKTNGNGLGLFHAKNTIDSWGGTIELNSRLGVGTRVRISLPILPSTTYSENRR